MSLKSCKEIAPPEHPILILVSFMSRFSLISCPAVKMQVETKGEK